MAQVHGGRLVMKALKQEGIDHLFGIVAVPILPLYDACLDEGIRNIDVRHEAAAVHMADGWARATGRPGFATVISGPGVTNALTAIANARDSGSPIVVLVTRGGHAADQRGAMHDMDQDAVLKPVSKWVGTCHDTKRLPEYVAIALRHAMSGRPGPAVLEVTGEVLSAKVEEDEVWYPRGYRPAARPKGDPEQVRAAAELLLRAERPVVIGGSGIFYAQAGQELQQLIELVEAPLALGWQGRGVVPEDHPLCFGPNRAGVREADVVLLAGTRLNYMLNYGQPPLFNPQAKFIQIDIQPEEIGRNRNIDVGIQGDAKAVLGQLIEELRGNTREGQHAGWIRECQDYMRRRREEMATDATSDAVPIHPARLCNEISGVLRRDANVIMDGGEITVFGPQYLRVHQPGHWMDNGPFGCLGPGTSFAIAAKLARPQEQVLLLSGDGAFGFNAMEFDTAARHHVPFVCVVGDNGVWAMETHPQEALYGKERMIGGTMGVRDYHKMVEAMGGYGEYVERPQDIRPALERAFASGKPACVNVATDPAAAPGRRRGARPAVAAAATA
ncbi:MAG: thiamine pyrophosphate-binding protein [Chloroflexi bacterium]|nr:thiamine pyrophosphate-binding protein [Chloroflexota bacterium]